MINKEILLELFKKYQFDSLTKEPYIFMAHNKIGIYYTFKEELYGTLNRVFLPQDKESAEEFLKNYYLYRNQNIKKTIKMTLPVYDEAFVKPNFKEEVEILNEEKKDFIEANRHLRSASLLIEIIKEKLKVSLITYENVKELTEQYNKIKKEWSKKRYHKEEDITPTDTKAISKIKIEQEQIVKDLEETLKGIKTEKELSEIIYSLLDYLKALEMEDSLINNKYFLLKIPLEIDYLKKEIEVIDNFKPTKQLKKRKNKGNKTDELEEKLNEIAQKYQTNKIITLPSFVKNEQQRIEEKYDMIHDMELGTAADYLIEFDNLNIKEAKIKKKEKATNIIVTEEEAIKQLQEDFEKLPDENKNILYLMTYFQKYYNDYSIEKQFLLKELLKIIQSPTNILAKIKIFKKVNFSSLEDFNHSVDQIFEAIKQYPTLNLSKDITIYFEQNSILYKNDMLFASSKKDCMPRVSNVPTPIIYIAKLQKNAHVYFTPKKLTIDFKTEDKLILKENYPLFIISCENNMIKNTKSDIIKVAKVKIDKKEQKDIKIVTSLRIEDITNYKYIEIAGKEE